MKVLVLGAGVIGLSCAWELLHAGYKVEVWAAAFSPHTCSDQAAAFWEPFAVQPLERVEVWARKSYFRFQTLAAQPETGIKPVYGRQVVTFHQKRPWWHVLLPDFEVLIDSKSEFEQIWTYTSWLIETQRYLPWLHSEVIRMGATLQQKTVSDLSEASACADWVINCTGLGSQKLCQDPHLYPLRGQTVKVKAPKIRQFLIHEVNPEQLAYIFPREDGCILGGTVEVNKWSEHPDAQISQEILERCTYHMPYLAQCQILSDQVGLRPARHEVRLERDGCVIHNYGHGGAGITLSWGCAEAVLQQLTKLNSRNIKGAQ